MGISYKHFLYGAITFATLLAAFFKIGVFRTTSSGPTEFFWGFLYLVFIGWAGGQLWLIRSRVKPEETESKIGAASSLMRPEDQPGEDTLMSAEVYLSMGESLDTVCAFVNPKYQDWDSSEKLIFRQHLKAALDQRRTTAPGPEAGSSSATSGGL